MTRTGSIHETPVVRAGITIPGIHRLATYRAEGGYQALRQALAMDPPEVIGIVTDSGLTGRGGANFPTGRKWRAVLEAPGAATAVVNGDESEPGSFKDREMMETLPHRVLEGALIAAHAVRATALVVFIRGEYDLARERMLAAIDEARADGIIGGWMPLDVTLHRSAGAYICGEETALIEALEGERPMPRGKPPYPAVSGLHGLPTLVNNVETLANVPAIVARGAAWYRTLGTPDAPGTRVFSLSGNVRHPGNYECVLGTRLSDLIEGLGGGVPGDRPIKAVIPGGTSSPVLTARQLDVALTPAALTRAGSMLGTAAVIVYDDTTCMVDVAANLSLFYRDESCGKCTPCREGTFLFHAILTRIENGLGRPDDLERLEQICHYIPGESLCALGDAAVAPVASTLKHFRGEYLTHIREGRCPVRRQHEVAGQCFPVIHAT
ncbi:MAG: NADH-quinone oxidoreductase subunit NuoF [Nitrospirae bacterium]|nr:NADH-quinone oxidoreductase subunit NuoF [Nitrospirota bacterium]